MKASSVLVWAIMLCAIAGAWLVADARVFGFVAGGVGGLVLGVAILSYDIGADECDYFSRD